MKLALKLPRHNKDKSSSQSKAAANSGIELVWITTFAITLLLVVGAAAFSFLQISSKEGGLEQNQIEQSVAGYAAHVAEMVNYTATSMESVVKDPQLIQFFVDNDQAGIEAREQSLGYQFPASIRVKLLGVGLSEPDNNMTPPLGYACLDMLRQAENKKTAPIAEIHSHGAPEQHIDFVQPVIGPLGRPIGNLLVSFSVPSLQGVMARLAIKQGYVELLQSGAKGDVIIASRGDRALRQGEAIKQLAIAGSHWKVAYWSGDLGGVLTIDVIVMFWVSFGVIILLIAGLMFVMYQKLNRSLRQDQITIIRIFKDIVDDNLSRDYPVSLANNRGIIEQLRKMAWDFSSSSAPKPYAQEVAAAKASRQGAGGAPVKKSEDEESDDIEIGSLTDPTFMGSALQVEDSTEDFGAVSSGSSQGEGSLSASIFRAYDIRGVAGTDLTVDLVRDIGRSIGSEAHDRGQQKIVVARDGRLSGPQMSEALMLGLQQAGCEVIDIGQVPTPVLYFAAQYLGNGCGVMVTGSHNPANYNGMKVMLRGETLHNESIQALRTRIESGTFVTGEGSLQNVDVIPSYVERITSDVRLERELKVVVDCGNGVAGGIAPQLLRSLGCEVIELYCDVDGNFPNHHPDPSKPENLIALTRAVAERDADIGIAFDGDGDRLGVVDSEGKIIWPDRLLMLLARDVLLRQPGAQIIYDVKCSRHMDAFIREHGGEPLMWKSGHSYLKAKLQETGAQLAGELSGHIFFSERWLGFDDGLYAAARLLEVLSQESEKSNKVFSTLPDSVCTPELLIDMSEGENFALMDALLANANFPGAHLVTIDGLRVEFEDGWGLIRASNTTPSLTMRFEAENAEALRRIQDEFRQQLQNLSAGLNIPF